MFVMTLQPAIFGLTDAGEAVSLVICQRCPVVGSFYADYNILGSRT